MDSLAGASMVTTAKILGIKIHAAVMLVAEEFNRGRCLMRFEKIKKM